MKILKFKLLKDFARKHPDAADALMRWAEYVEKTEWKSHAELKQAFPSADYVGNDRYVFNISGNKFRLVTIVVFFQGFLHIRFVGTHAEYDKIKDIKNIITMTIKDEKTYNEIEERMETLLAKGTQLGGMDFLSEVEKEELKVLSEAAYDWECEVDPHPWRVKPSLIAAIKVAFRQKGYKQKEAAKAIGVSTTALSDILHGRRAINFDVARNIYHNLGVPANVVLG